MMVNNQTLEKRISDLEQRVSVLESKLKSPNTSIIPKKHKALSEKEYILEKAPKSSVEKTLFLGAYLEKYKELDFFTVEDLRKAFRAAREPVPSNINDMINKNIKKGLFMEGPPSEDKKTWQLTATGERMIESGIEKG